MLDVGRVRDPSECGLVGVLPGLGAFVLISCSEFGATTHDDTHDAFMTLSPYTQTRGGEVPPRSWPATLPAGSLSFGEAAHLSDNASLEN